MTTEVSGWKEGAAWPGPEQWHVSVGEGSTSPIVAEGRLYTLGWKGGQDQVVCLDAVTGREVWRQVYPSPKYGRFAMGDQNFYAGPSGTPEYDEQTGFLYTLSIDGTLSCWDTRADGKRVWALNFYDQYQGMQRPQATKRGGTHRDYGVTGSPLVMGEVVIIEVGDDQGSLMAFDRRTGMRRWASECKQPAGHSGGPVPITVEGVACVAVFHINGLLVTRTDGPNAGKTVAEFPWVTDFANNIAMPGVWGDSILLTSAYNHRKMVRVKITLKGAEQVWEQPVCSGVCGPVVHDGKVYWAWEGMHCLDWETGEELWSGGRFGIPSSLAITADDRIIVWTNEGELALVDTAKRSPKEFHQLTVKSGLAAAEAWPHVAVANGRAYVKDRAGNLKCLLLSAGK